MTQSNENSHKDTSFMSRMMAQWVDVKSSVLDKVDTFLLEQYQHKQETFLYLDRKTSPDASEESKRRT